MQRDKVKLRVYITGMLIFGAALYFIVSVFRLHFSDRIIVNNTGGPTLRRGFIRDRGGHYLAMSIERESLFANPRQVKDPALTAAALSPLLGISKDIIEERLRRGKSFTWLKRKLDDAAAERIRALKLPGLNFRKEMQRVYPAGTLASNLLGFVGIENRGLEGIEYKFEDLLSGAKVLDAGAGGLRAGYTVVLTLDRFVQYQAERGIEEAVRATGAKQGTVLVMEVKTGRVLAIGKYPSFDPNFYQLYTADQRRSYTVTDSFEPGSTMKVLAMALLLELFPNLNRQYQCRGSVEVADTVINCLHVHGNVTLDDIIRYSCNAGMIQAMRAATKQSYHDLLRRFGFGARTGVELPGESEGILRPLKSWSGLSKYSMAIGQEISVTSLQLAAAFSAIGNRGVYMAPGIIEAIERDDGTPVQTFFPRSRGQVIRKETADRLLRMMKLSVEAGTGKRAAIAYYFVIGKTGTAQKSRPTGGYYPDRETAVFVGLAPYHDPELCILVVLDEPAGASGGAIAAPVFARVAERILPFLGVHPNYVSTKGEVKRLGVPPRFDGVTMPDLRGLSMAESLQNLSAARKKFAVSYSFSGTGRVFHQEPVPGAKLEPRAKLRIFLKEGK
jgi:cell division protein FtsI (penicillin-binding protein 3)